MKIWIAAFAAFIGILAIGMVGCGGGGTGSGGSNGGAIVRYKVEATLNGQLIDPNNIQVGETVQFVVAGYTASNTRVVQSATDWTTTDIAGNAGTLSPNGTFTATGASGPYTISATTSVGQESGAYDVKIVQALVGGTLVDGQGRFVEGVRVLFYDGAGTLVGSSTSQSNGFFRASVPTTATTFDIDTNSINHSAYYNEYQYNGSWYLPPAGVCRPGLPGLTNGGSVSLGTITVPATTSSTGATLPPPPPPTGCG